MSTAGALFQIDVIDAVKTGQVDCHWKESEGEVVHRVQIFHHQLYCSVSLLSLRPCAADSFSLMCCNDEEKKSLNTRKSGT